MSNVDLTPESTDLQQFPVIYVQQDILECCIILLPKIQELHKKLFELGLLKSESKIKFSPYNGGYQIQVSVHFNWVKITQGSRLLNQLASELTGTISSYCYPASFFEDCFEKGDARIESNDPKTYSRKITSFIDVKHIVSDWLKCELAKIDKIDALLKLAEEEI